MRLPLAFIISVVVLTAFEITKTLLASDIQLWISHVLTILFTSVMAAILLWQYGKQKELLSSLKQSQAMLDAVSRTQSSFISNAGHHKTFAKLLKILLDASHSEFGFISEVVHHEGSAPFLLTHACSGISSASALAGTGNEYAQAGIELRDQQTLPGAVLMTGQTVVVNDAALDARPSGLPLGYPPTQNFLGVPLYQDATLVGVVGLFNRPGGYTPNLRSQLSQIMLTCVSLITAHRGHVARKELERRLNLTKTAVNKSKVSFFLLNADMCLIDVNDYACESLGFARDELIGKHIWEIDPDYAPESRFQSWKALKERGSLTFEAVHRRKDGTRIPVEITSNYVAFGDEEYRFSFARDIRGKKEQDALIWKQANYDMLTELPNRRLLQDRLQQEIKKAHRTSQPLALVLIDLDRFKEINDNLGHAKGDTLLIEAARRIVGCVRETDTVARLGGDEFTVILPDFGDRLHLDRIAQDIIRELSEPFYLGNEQMGYFISASVGITLYPYDAQDIDNLLRQADQAMYRAKAEGRGRFSYFTSSMQQEARDKLALSLDLRQALARQEMQVHYQPIIDLASGRIVKAEALLRWKHPERGLISPATFIPLAEEAGLAQDIDELVFRQATASIQQWHRQFGRIIQVAINQSPTQLAKKTGLGDWHGRLRMLDLPGDSIKVEITEGALLNNSPTIKMKLREFQSNGIEVSIDDFGTGFSSLSYLKEFDIDYLKIDKSFTANLAEDASSKALTEAIIVMAHKLGIKTIAEGVEHENQEALLVAFGCDYAQGFLYSPAVAADEFAALLLAAEQRQPLRQAPAATDAADLSAC